MGYIQVKSSILKVVLGGEEQLLRILPRSLPPLHHDGLWGHHRRHDVRGRRCGRVPSHDLGIGHQAGRSQRLLADDSVLWSDINDSISFLRSV